MDHFYKSLPGWASFAEIYQVAVSKAKGGETFVEVGSWLGRSAAFMAVEIFNSGKKIDFHCVDPWIDGGPDLRNTSYYKDLKESPFDIFTRNVAPVSHLITAHRMPSVEASKLFADQSVDFVMLDGDHNYAGIRADIDAWLPKMKPGAIMSGDDYLWPGVTKAADETFGDKLRPVIKSPKPNYRNSVAYWWTQLPQ
jgi:hypothetical protein